MVVASTGVHSYCLSQRTLSVPELQPKIPYTRWSGNLPDYSQIPCGFSLKRLPITMGKSTGETCLYVLTLTHAVGYVLRRDPKVF